jgi:hypothetical protein
MLVDIGTNRGLEAANIVNNSVTAPQASLPAGMLEANIQVWGSQRLRGRVSSGRLCGCSRIGVTTRRRSRISQPQLGSRR